MDLEAAGASEADAVAQAKKKAEGERTRLKIAAWVQGRKIDHDENGEMHERGGGPIGNLKLTTTKATAKQQVRDCDEPFTALRLKLMIYWLDDDAPFTVVDEKTVPKEHPCITGCTFGPIFAQAKSAVFVLQCGIQGFEGPATLAVPVVSKLPYGLDEDLPVE